MGTRCLKRMGFFLMVFDHLTYDLGRVFKFIWFDGPTDHWLYRLCKLCSDYRDLDIALFLRVLLVSGVFLFIAGVSANLSKNNVVRGLKLLIVSLALTLITALVENTLKISGVTVYFGILHCLAVAILLTPLLLKLNRYVMLSLGIVITVFGMLMEVDVINFTSSFVSKLNEYYLLVPFNIYGYNFSSGDYYPLIPYMGIYIIGIFVGQIVYANKQSLFQKERNIKPLNFLWSQCSLVIFCSPNPFIWLFIFGWLDCIIRK